MNDDTSVLAEQLTGDAGSVATVAEDPERADESWDPAELAGYEISAAKKNCGSECGCDADKGVGCKGKHGTGTGQADCKPQKPGGTHECPYKTG